MVDVDNSDHGRKSISSPAKNKGTAHVKDQTAVKKIKRRQLMRLLLRLNHPPPCRLL
ncbi:hypothetical protein I3843_10G043400 [Carya illinoinensis]|nr:hypothetical protein I3843_10G043400 [Carya illinoinensis]